MQFLSRRVEELEAALRQMHFVVSTDRCDGDSELAAGINLATSRQAERLATILKAHGVDPSPHSL